MKNQDLDLKSIGRQLQGVIRTSRRYAGVIIFVLFGLSYGIVVLRINMLSSAPVTPSGASSSPTLRIDANAAKQLQSLKDNSSNVQTLFEQGRTNPFQE